MRRAVVVLAFALVGLVFAGAGAAPEGTPGSGFRSRVSEVEPLVPGLLVEVLGGDELLSVRNWTGTTVVLEGPEGRPFVRLHRDVVERRVGGRWRTVKRGTSYAWHDPRIHATGPAPDREGLVRRWRIPGKAGGKPFAIVGFLGYRPSSADAPGEDAALPAWTIALAGAGGVLLVAAALVIPLRGRDARDDPP